MPKSNIKPEDRVRLRHMLGMRNRLIHAYFSINLDIVWSTSTEDIPALIAELINLLGDVP